MPDWPIPTKARMDEIFESVKNWGRWGEDDEAGALNLITDEVRRRWRPCVTVARSAARAICPSTRRSTIRIRRCI